MDVIADVGGTNIRLYTLKPSSLSKNKITRLIVGLRGVSTPSEKKAWKKKLATYAPHVKVFSDIELAHHLAFGKEDGIVLNAGTGSIVYGRYKGKIARAGGVGPLLGDEGSAFAIGREYLRRNKSWQFRRKIAVGPNPVAKTASFAIRAIKDRSWNYGMTVGWALTDLFSLLDDVLRELRVRKPVPLVVRGGLFSNSRFRDHFWKGISRSYLKRRVRRSV